MNLHRFYQGKKVFITGHAGFKGSWLVEVLLAFGAQVCGYSLKPQTRPNLFTVLELKGRIKHLEADVRDFESLNAAVRRFSPDVIFHLAAQPLVRNSYDRPRYTYEANLMGTVNLLEAIRLNKTPAGVIITTDKVYRNLERDIAYKENDALGGYDPYSNSKACADLAVNSYIQSFFNPKDFKKSHRTLIASARAGNVIGGGDWAKDRLLPDAMRAFLSQKTDLIIRNPEAIRPWQHVFEPLYGYLLLAKSLYLGETAKSGAWNFAPRKENMQTVKAVLDLVTEFLETGKYWVEKDKSKHEASCLKLDGTKTRKELGWLPKLTLKEAVFKTVEWYREFYSHKARIKDFSLEQVRNYFELEGNP